MKIREQRIRLSGSPYYQIKIGVIAAGGFVFYTYDSAELISARKYAPLDFCEICNDDIVPLEVQINQQDTFYVPASTVKTVTEHPIHHIRVKNVHASTSTTADKTRILCQKEPLTTDKYVRRLKL